MRMLQFVSIMLILSICGSLHAQKLINRFATRGAKVIQKSGNSFMETSDSGYVYIEFHPDKQVVTKVYPYKDVHRLVPVGVHKNFYDSGELFRLTTYREGRRHGYQELHSMDGCIWSGHFYNDQKSGKWMKTDDEGKTLLIENYLRGELHGEYITYDSLGVAFREEYQHGRLLGAEEAVKKEDPRFPGCERQGLPDSLLKSCAEGALLQYLYKKIRYPNRAINKKIEGRALVQFVVEKDGSVNDVKFVNALCDDIEKAIWRIFVAMPNFRPGYQNGEPVRVDYMLPIEFRIR